MRTASAAKPSSTPSTSARPGGCLGAVVGEGHAARLDVERDVRRGRRDLSGLGADVTDAVVLVDEDDGGGVGAGVGVAEHPVGDDDDEVAGVDVVGGGAVDLHLAAAALAGDDVGGEPRAVGDVDDVDLLAGQQVRGVEEVGVHGEGADVVQVGGGHGGTVDLADEHRPVQRAGRRHRQWSSRRWTVVLSMSRVPPTQAATASSAAPPWSGGTGAMVSGSTSSR